MLDAVKMATLWRGDFAENVHFGHAVIADRCGNIIEGWGDPDVIVFPRSSCKMIQALGLVESGAADAYGLDDSALALACASHSGSVLHTDKISMWLSHIGFCEADLLCGVQAPAAKSDRARLLSMGKKPSQIHNNCSGKHTGFLTLSRHLKISHENYTDPEHKIQKIVREIFEDVTDMPSPGFGIDGCSAPNFTTKLSALSRAMAFFASPPKTDLRGKTAQRLVRAMATYPLLVAGKGRACSRLIRTMGKGNVVKTGACGVFTAILPGQGLGVAVKILDGNRQASETVITALLVKLGVLHPKSEVAQFYLTHMHKNWRKTDVAVMRPDEKIYVQKYDEKER